MKIAVIHATQRKGSTYHTAWEVLNRLPGAKQNQVTEFFLTKDMPEFCVGCGTCIMKGEKRCPHRAKLEPIIQAMDAADLLVFDTPTFVLHSAGSMKAFLDHFGYRFMVHRPEGSMFRKTALVVSTAAGGGMKGAVKDVKDSLNYWGVAHTVTLPLAVYAVNWEEMPQKRKNVVLRKAEATAKKLTRLQKRGPSLKVRGTFYVMRIVHSKALFTQIDADHWKANGWLGKARPWKTK